MPEFSFTSPSISAPLTGARDKLQGQAGRYRQVDFLNEIVDAVNKAAEDAKKATDKIGEKADVGRFINNVLSVFVPKYRMVAPIVDLAIGGGETHYTNKEMEEAEDAINQQASRGYLSSQLPQYADAFGEGRKDRRSGNMLDSLTRFALGVYGAHKGGAYDNLFSKGEGVSPRGVMTQGLKFGSLGRDEGVMGLQPITQGFKDPRMQSPADVLDSIFTRGTSDFLEKMNTNPPTLSPYSNLGIGG